MNRPKRPLRAVQDGRVAPIKRDPKKVVAYVRVSTDDQDQRPERQVDFLTPWAAEHGIEIVGWVIDEGTSAYKVPPLQRQKIREAIRIANTEKAGAILVEDLDRFCRGGNKELAVAEVRLDLEFGLDVIYAKMPTGIEGMMLEMMKVMKAEMALESSRLQGERITEGLKLAKKNGWPMGRPGPVPKTPMTTDERAMVRGWRDERPPVGWRRCALKLSTNRGAFDYADPKLMKRTKISEAWLPLHLDDDAKSPVDSARCRPKKRITMRADVAILVDSAHSEAV